MQIDIHAHHLPTAYMELLSEGAGPIFGAPHDPATLDAMITGQDAIGIDLQVLSTGPNSPYLRDAAQAAYAARHINDAYHDIVARSGGRFAAFGSVPLPHAGGAAIEAVRCLDELGLAGIHLGCSALGRPLDDPDFAEMWRELDRREAVVFVHPGGILCGSEPGLAGMDDPGIAVTIGSAAELATAALRLAALCRSHRRLKIVIGLLGGALPFLLQRVVWLGSRFKGASVLATECDQEDLLTELRRFHFDINLLPDPNVLRLSREVFGLERLVFGSDAPSGLPSAVATFMRDAGFSDGDQRKVMLDNPAALFRSVLHHA